MFRAKQKAEVRYVVLMGLWSMVLSKWELTITPSDWTAPHLTPLSIIPLSDLYFRLHPPQHLIHPEDDNCQNAGTILVRESVHVYV
jgi:hypothetical protein